MLFACNGGCPKDRFLATPDGEPPLNYLCEGYQLFFHQVAEPMSVMAGLLREGRAATALRGWYADRDRTREDSDPCPCRSGRPWGGCHGAR